MGIKTIQLQLLWYECYLYSYPAHKLLSDELLNQPHTTKTMPIHISIFTDKVLIGELSEGL